MDRDVFIWSGLALVAAMVATPALLAGGFPLLPLFFAGVALAGAAHSGSRALVIGVALRLLSGGALRTAVVVLGALMLIQLLPIELALLMAGDVLAYVEVLAAVSLIAANTRVREVRRGIGRRLDRWRRTATARVRRRGSRSVRPVRPRSPPSADDDPSGVWAFA
ncbi:hypothetical protein [Brevundimonas sp.]|uniref:hypothetical protein n=1 Tax=Brevundimonas sp. TaxID=1871086 RepID=UPI0035AF4EE3